MDGSPLNDWEIPAEEIVICKRDNGEQWRLGSGGAPLLGQGSATGPSRLHEQWQLCPGGRLQVIRIVLRQSLHTQWQL